MIDKMKAEMIAERAREGNIGEENINEVALQLQMRLQQKIK
jgi:hypothetical protein